MNINQARKYIPIFILFLPFKTALKEITCVCHRLPPAAEHTLPLVAG
jgi:hypothetical protein